MKNIYKILFSSTLLLLLLLVSGITTEAYGGCSQYGTFAMENYAGNCKCMSGYVFDKNFLGEDYCVSGDSVCSDKLGYGSDYNSSTGSCECSYGYVLGKDSIGRTKCISDNDACQNQLGFNSRSTYGDKCECSYGYVIGDSRKCENADSFCSDKYGYYSSYDSLSNTCECDDGYTLKNGECKEKNNSAYYNILAVNENDNLIIVESEYDYNNYEINYSYGCYDWYFNSGDRIVINMGTDFSIDFGDKLVIGSNVCDVSSSSLTFDDSFGEVNNYVAPVVAPVEKKEVSENIIIEEDITKTTIETEETQNDEPKSDIVVDELVPETEDGIEIETKKVSVWKRIISWFGL
jgi:hypothetical protein